MQYTTLRQTFADFQIFSLSDIRKIDPHFHLRRLSEWQKKGYIRKLVKGYYTFSDLKVNERVLFLAANKIYHPSYVSLESALSYYHLIPDTVYGITSVSTRRTISFRTPLAEFLYRTQKPSLFFGYELVSFGGQNFKMAGIEKALLDHFYFRGHLRDEKDFTGMRLNKEILFTQMSEEKFFMYLDKFQQKVLSRRIRSFWRFLKNA